MRLSWRVATYVDLTPSAALSGCLEPTCCLGVLDASEGLNVWIKVESRKLILEFDGDSNCFFVWEVCSEDIIVDICS